MSIRCNSIHRTPSSENLPSTQQPVLSWVRQRHLQRHRLGQRRAGPAGGGILTLTANNTYSSYTLVAAGSLEVGNGGTTGSIVGDVVNNGSLAFNRADDIAYGGAISGSGVFTKAGAGSLTLSGNSTYTGGTTVAFGTLNVAGSLGQTAVSVNGGATLMGSGSIGGPVIVQNGGILSGASGTTLDIGALALNGGATTNALINGPGLALFDVARNWRRRAPSTSRPPVATGRRLLRDRVWRHLHQQRSRTRHDAGRLHHRTEHRDAAAAQHHGL